MINHEDILVVTSAIPEFSGVTFTIKKISHGLRTKIRRDLAAALAKIREKSEQIESIVDDFKLSDEPEEPQQLQLVELDDKGEVPAKKPGVRFNRDQTRAIQRITDINNDIEIITAGEVDPVYLRQAFISIDGFQIDGKAPDANTMYERGPEELCQEIIRAIKSAAGLTVAVKENLELPITSGAAAGGQMNDTIAPAASSMDGTENVTATSSSQKV